MRFLVYSLTFITLLGAPSAFSQSIERLTNLSKIPKVVYGNQVIRAVIDYAARVLRACSSGVGTCSPRLASL
ncbi:MAG: hypothetical protein SGJ18_12770, partial [Pseudomonadota bacterium]|nr:hypothetical protein [Pseudomonadota bacterium]